MDERGLGQQIQSMRKAAGLTQQALCQKANISFSTLTKIERGAIKAPSIFTIQSVAQALELSLDALLGNAGASRAASRVLHKTKSGISFVYFDVNDCLVRFYQRAFAHIAQDYDVPADVVETAHWHYTDDTCRGRISLEDFNKAMAQRMGVEGSVDWASYYLEAAEGNEDMHQLVRWAAERYRVGLLTNVMPGILGQLRQLGKVPNVAYDAIIDSSEIGMIKPELAIFQHAQVEAGVPPEEILFIDDTKSNLTAAETLGWHVVQFDYANPVESVEKIRSMLEPAA
ncbi:MAG: hypothetical protein JWN38_669 [Candidatus Saccharibacteria bacterium]|nr:hypothetical protein [Candidatus Saccharibacteria bacterium]